MTAGRPERAALDEHRVVQTAITLADSEGLNQLSMRRLAQELGVQAMSLYHHVANKEALLDRMVDSVMGEIQIPSSATPWRQAMVRRVHSARAALIRHRWAAPLMDSRTGPGPCPSRRQRKRKP